MINIIPHSSTADSLHVLSVITPHHIIQGPAHPIQELKQRQRIGKEQMCNVEVGQSGWGLETLVVIRTKAGQERRGQSQEYLADRLSRLDD